MKVLVTGGAGFIGSNLVRMLVASGNDVRVLDDLSTGLASNIAELTSAGRVELMVASMADPAAVVEAARARAVIAHLGARGSIPRSIADPRATHDVNSTGTLNVLEAARAHGCRVVWASSASVYGLTADLPRRENLPVRPMTPYGVSKAVGEGYARAYAHCYGLPVTTLRLFNVYGPYQRPDHEYAAVIPKWIWAGLNGEPIHLNGEGDTSRDFTFVDDVVDVLHAVINGGPIHPEPVNIAFGRPVTLRELHAAIEGAVGAPIPIISGPERPGDIRHSRNDPSLVDELFPSTRRTPLAEGLAATVAFLRDLRRGAP